MAGDETRLQIFGSASALWLYSARGKYSSNTSSFLLAFHNGIYNSMCIVCVH